MNKILDRDLTEIFPEYLGFEILDTNSLCIVCSTDGKSKEFALARYLTRETMYDNITDSPRKVRNDDHIHIVARTPYHRVRPICGDNTNPKIGGTV